MEQDQEMGYDEFERAMGWDRARLERRRTSLGRLIGRVWRGIAGRAVSLFSASQPHTMRAPAHRAAAIRHQPRGTRG